MDGEQEGKVRGSQGTGAGSEGAGGIYGSLLARHGFSLASREGPQVWHGSEDGTYVVVLPDGEYIILWPGGKTHYSREIGPSLAEWLLGVY